MPDGGYLTLLFRRSVSYKNQSTDLQSLSKKLEVLISLTLIIFSFCSFSSESLLPHKNWKSFETDGIVSVYTKTEENVVCCKTFDIRFSELNTKTKFLCYNSAIHLPSSTFHSFSLCYYILPVLASEAKKSRAKKEAIPN